MTLTAGPRRRIDREQVIETAEAIVDEGGWDHLTMAALAGALGIKVPSLYNHVAGLDDVKAGLQIRAMRQLAQALVSAAMGRSGDDGVRALAEVHRQYANRYPHRYEGATRQSIDREAFVEAAMVANDAFVAVIRSFGHGDHATLQLGLAIFASLHGAVTLEISGFFGDSATADELHETLVAEALQLLTRPGGGPGRIRLPRRPAHPATLGQPRGS